MKKILKQMLALCFTLSLIGCSQSSSEVIELSKNKYKADSNGYVSIKGKLIENDLILNVKDDDDLLETQSCDVQDNGKFTISLKFNEIINNDTPEVTIYTTYEGEEYRKKVKVNIKDYIDSIYQKDEEEKKEQEQLENEKSDLESYKDKTVCCQVQGRRVSDA